MLHPQNNLATNILGGRRSIIATAALSLVSGSACSLGLLLRIFDRPTAHPLAAICLIVAWSALFFVALTAFWRILDRRKTEKGRLSYARQGVTRPTRACALAAGAILACWTPVLLAGYPGFFAYDSGIQDSLMQWAQIESGTLNAHHSIVHTWFVEATVKAGIALFGTFNAGICVSAVTQALIVAAVFAFVLRALADDGMTRGGFVLASAYFALNPIIAMFALCTTKDTLFGACAVAYCILLVKLHESQSREHAPNPFRQGAALAIVGFLLCVLRSNAIVAFLVFAAPVFLMLRGRRRLFLLCTASCLALALAWLGPVSTAIGVQPSPIGLWNALGVPMQQIARCDHSPEVSEQDKSAIEAVLGEVGYKPNNSDIARDSFCWRDGGNREVLELYVHLGMRYPGVFLEALLYQTEDAWSPFATIDAYNDDGLTSVFDFRTMEPGHMEPILPDLAHFLRILATEPGAERTVGIHWLASIAFYLFAMSTCLTRCFIKQDKAGLYFTVPLAALALTNLLGPCMLIRYFLYLFFALPGFLHFLLRQ